MKDENKTNAYLCHLEPDELERQRQEFWKQKMHENTAVWYIICEACHTDEAQARAILEAAGFKMPNGTLENIQSAKGDKYKIPIYCINDPINYTAEYHIEKLKLKDRPQNTKMLNIRVVNAKDGTKITLDIENTEDVVYLKQMYAANYD